MNQIRYFLAVSRTLNFTRAAEECNVAQPSLTRAIKLLEGELGGDLFRRERNLSHLTDLGERMLPLMTQCYDSAISAKSLATSIKTGDIQPLRLALSRTIGIMPLVPHLTELTRNFKGLELKFQRGDAAQVLEALKKGEAELAIAGPLPENWERFDAWPLFTENYMVAVSKQHRFAGRNAVDLAELSSERLLERTYCEHWDRVCELLRGKSVGGTANHQVATDADVIGLLDGNVGVAIVPASFRLPASAVGVTLNGLDLTRVVSVYGVAGRQRSPVATTFLKLLRAADWSQRSD